MNKLQVFQNSEFGKISILVEDGKELFPASECAKILGYSNPHKAINDHCRCLTKREVPHPQSPALKISINFIPEGDLYRLIIRSNLSNAERFERWVFDEVLPSIRKHGMYATPASVEDMLADPDTMIKALQALKDERQKRLEAEQQIKQQKPLIQFAETCQASEDSLLIRDLAKVIGTTGEKRLFQTLRDWQLIYKKDGRNLPYQKYVERGYFVVTEAPYITEGEVRLALTTRVTPKGQQYIIARLAKTN